METRFFSRKSHHINYNSFLEVMREILDDNSLVIEDYPALSLYSIWHDCYYDDDEIMVRISIHLQANIINYYDCKGQECIYFIEDK